MWKFSIIKVYVCTINPFEDGETAFRHEIIRGENGSEMDEEHVAGSTIRMPMRAKSIDNSAII